MWFGHDPKVIFLTRPFTSRTSEVKGKEILKKILGI